MFSPCENASKCGILRTIPLHWLHTNKDYVVLLPNCNQYFENFGFHFCVSLILVLAYAWIIIAGVNWGKLLSHSIGPRRWYRWCLKRSPPPAVPPRRIRVCACVILGQLPKWQMQNLTLGWGSRFWKIYLKSGNDIIWCILRHFLKNSTVSGRA